MIHEFSDKFYIEVNFCIHFSGFGFVQLSFIICIKKNQWYGTLIILFSLLEGLSNCRAEQDRKSCDKQNDQRDMKCDVKVEAMESTGCRTSAVDERKEDSGFSCKTEVSEADCRWQGK